MMTINESIEKSSHSEWDELSEWLSNRISTLKEWHDGRIYETKQFVENDEKLNIQVYSNDHAPPHFHVKFNEHEAVYLLDKSSPLTILKGSLPTAIEKRLKYMYDFRFREKLIQTWNNTRPYHLEFQKIL